MSDAISDLWRQACANPIEAGLMFALMLGASALFAYWTERATAPQPQAEKPTPTTPQPAAPKRRKERKPPIPVQPGNRVIWIPGKLSFVRECQLDECMTHRYQRTIGRHGYPVFTTQALGLVQATDRQQLAAAAKARRILITEDRDFLKLDAQGLKHAGILLVPKGEEWEQQAVAVLLRLFA